MLDFLFPTDPNSRTQRTRQRILKAAIDVFSHKGYHETRVDEIVTESQTSKGAVYSHFASKERIFLAIVDEFADALVRHLDTAIEQADNGIDRVDAALQVCLDTFRRHRRLARIFLVQAIGLGKVFEEKRLQVHSRFVHLIERYLDQAVSEGDIPPQDTAVAAYAWMGAINETVIHWLHTGQPDLETALPALRRVLLRSIGVTELRLEQRQPPHISLDPEMRISAGDILSYTLPWTDVSLLGFLQQSPNSPRVYWSNANAPVALAGYGATAWISATGASRFSDIRGKARQIFNRTILCGDKHPPEVGPRLLGGFSFHPWQEDELWRAFPPAWFVLPTYQLTRYEGRTWLTINQYIEGKTAHSSIAETIQQKCNTLIGSGGDGANGANIKGVLPVEVSCGTSQSEWQQHVRMALEQIKESTLEKVVLARYSQFRASVSSLRMLWKLKQHYADCYRFLFEPRTGHSFYGASPELLVEINGSKLRSVALAGSIERGHSDDEDVALGQQLLASNKDKNEHRLVVRAIRQGLEPLVRNMYVPDAPQLLQLSNIQHLETTIEGTIAEGADILSIVGALHPTPAVGGVPSKQSRELIASTEAASRGWYAGPVGWIDRRGNGQFAVALRTAITVGHDTRLYAGAGIVSDSQPDLEWEETEWKLNPLLDALVSCASQER